jgi:L-aspartate oxidase
VYDVLVLGSGIAGLTTALHSAARGMSVVVLTKGELSHSATRYAQGGVAAALEDPDSPDLHLADTLVAGAGLCDVDAVRTLVTEGPARVRELAALGAVFDTEVEADGARLLLAREGGHSLARVVHAGGDATGAEIERALVAAVDPAPIEVRERWFALDLIVEDGCCRGVRALGPTGALEDFRAAHTVMATGGVGQCFAVTTNPTLSTGDGIALALRAGVACADLEFVQFHPTALHHPSMPRPLLSEALRGEGAVLRDVDGVAFMAGVHPLADLAPRDVVSRAIHRRMRETGSDHVYLDASMIDDFAQHFPTIWRACRSAGLDPTGDLLPVAPAAHYLSGGIVTDLNGASTMPSLWSCGEAACSGVHGANRLASNSLLDGLVFGRRVVEAIASGANGPQPTGAMNGVLQLADRIAETGPRPTRDGEGRGADGRGGDGRGGDGGGGDGGTDPDKVRSAIQRTMSADCGVVRDAGGLENAAEAIAELTVLAEIFSTRTVPGCEVLNLTRVAQAIVTAATARGESCGAHTRADFPDTRDELRGRFVLRGGEPPAFAALAVPSVAGS